MRKSASSCGVAVSTAFRWRHRFLRAPAANKPDKLSGIVEADEAFFRRSYKGSRRWTRPSPDLEPPSRQARHRGVRTGRRGTALNELVPVLVVRDRNRTTSDAVLADLKAETIGRHLLPLLAPDALLCTDASSAMPRSLAMPACIMSRSTAPPASMPARASSTSRTSTPTTAD